ncbi:hypothetical protein [Candidatus Mycobacterium methanotrophicum]|uniref:Uncharacterized protein n=2 Tax=Candidatus Mycobacterium methanotrophicum TaxID=2943498 RepID=A0ABY4QTW5_9MYCO|nr:hypothetical protein [Candidatus Mycobacterium methanotrophicum]UQX13368.1 hypothetical protein M5I08_20420 [Candidatus Mycobacterium methanotrophicum]
MGFGEGRVAYMVNTMESAPAQSLFVPEEPETSLHGHAQKRLASTYQIDSYLHADESKNKAVICVEDTFASHLAIEIMRRCDHHLLSGSQVLRIGSAQDVPSAVKLLRNAGLWAVGLRGGDMPSACEFIHNLPDDAAPEKVVLADPAVEAHFATEPYSVSIAELLTGVADHHNYLREIAARLMLEESVVATEACRVYAVARDESELSAVVDFLGST